MIQTLKTHHQLKRKLTGLSKNVVLLYLNLDNDKKCDIIVQGITIKSSQYWGNSMPGLSSLQVDIKKQPHNLAWINKEEQSLLKDLGGSGRPGPMGIPAYEDQDDPTNDDEEAAGYEGGGGGGSGAGASGGSSGEGGGWGEPDIFDPRDATYNAATNNFEFAVDTKSDNFLEDVATIGFDNFENPGGLDLATMEAMYNNPDAYGMGYNDFVDMGFFEKSEAADLASMRENAYKLSGKYGIPIGVDRDGKYNYGGPLGKSMAAAGKEALEGLKNLHELGILGVITGSPAGVLGNITSKFMDTVAPGVMDRFNPFSKSTAEMTKEERQAEIAKEDKNLSKTEREDKADDISFANRESDWYAKNAEQSLDRTASYATDKELGMDYATALAEDGYFSLSSAGEDKLLDTLNQNPILPKDEKSAMELYFERLAPSTSTAPSTAGPASTDVLSSQPNTDPEIANYAIKNNLTYQEAAKYFTPLSTITNVNTFPSAYGGGGVRGLMEYS